MLFDSVKSFSVVTSMFSGSASLTFTVSTLTLTSATASDTERTTNCIPIVAPSRPPLQCRLPIRIELRYSKNDVNDTKYTRLVSVMSPNPKSRNCSPKPKGAKSAGANSILLPDAFTANQANELRQRNPPTPAKV